MYPTADENGRGTGVLKLAVDEITARQNARFSSRQWASKPTAGSDPRSRPRIRLMNVMQREIFFGWREIRVRKLVLGSRWSHRIYGHGASDSRAWQSLPQQL